MHTLVEATWAEVRRADAEMIDTLRDAIANGSFEVHSDALSDRMVNDPFGLELLLDGAPG